LDAKFYRWTSFSQLHAYKSAARLLPSDVLGVEDRHHSTMLSHDDAFGVTEGVLSLSPTRATRGWCEM